MESNNCVKAIIGRIKSGYDTTFETKPLSSTITIRHGLRFGKMNTRDDARDFCEFRFIYNPSPSA